MAAPVSFDELAAANRAGAGNAELRRALGPTEAEQEAARTRMASLDRLDSACQWSTPTPSYQALEARERWQRLAGVQAEYETPTVNRRTA